MADSPYLPGNILSLAGAAADRLLSVRRCGPDASLGAGPGGGCPFPAVQAGAGPGARGCAGGSCGSRAA